MVVFFCLVCILVCLVKYYYPYSGGTVWNWTCDFELLPVGSWVSICLMYRVTAAVELNCAVGVSAVYLFYVVVIWQAALLWLLVKRQE
jgi:hypothetical protein